MMEKLEQQLLLKAFDKTEWKRDQTDAMGWQLMFEKTKQNKKPLGSFWQKQEK